MRALEDRSKEARAPGRKIPGGNDQGTSRQERDGGRRQEMERSEGDGLSQSSGPPPAKMGVRSHRELITLAGVVDDLLEGSLPTALDRLLQKFKLAVRRRGIPARGGLEHGKAPGAYSSDGGVSHHQGREGFGDLGRASGSKAARSDEQGDKVLATRQRVVSRGGETRESHSQPGGKASGTEARQKEAIRGRRLKRVSFAEKRARSGGRLVQEDRRGDKEGTKEGQRRGKSKKRARERERKRKSAPEEGLERQRKRQDEEERETEELEQERLP